MTFDEAFTRLMGHEGGYVNNPRDPGGETKYGISKRSYPDEDIAGLTRERAMALYWRDYWLAAHCDALPDALRFHVFDMAVNSGVDAAITTLQCAVGATPDGVVGPRTMRALHTAPIAQTVARFNGYRLQMLASLTTWPTFGRGWARRVAANLLL